MTATASTSRRTLLSAAMGATALGATLGPASASAGVDVPSDPEVDYFLDLPPIRGESVTRGYEDQIPVLDWSLGVDNKGSRQGGGGGGGARAGKPVPRPFTAVAHSSIASPPLFVATAAGTRFPRARLFGVRQGEDSFEFLIVTLEDVTLTSYAMAPDSVDAEPLDLLEIDYARMTIRWTPMSSEGGSGSPVSGGFDFAAGRRL